MDAAELIRRVKRIELKSRGLSQNVFAGQYRSAFKGRGMSFSEVREYQVGDDVRDIDWNVTARFNHPYVKVFEEERELTLMLLIDISGSTGFGTVNQTKRDMAIEIAATMAMSAIQNNDKIGAILFSDRIEKYIPPKKGRQHALVLIREMVTTEASSRQTDIGQALEFFQKVMKRHCAVMLLSDFLTANPMEQQLRMVAGKHDLMAVHLYDPREQAIPDVGLLYLEDAESGERLLVDTHSAKVRNIIAQQAQQRRQTIKELLMKTNTDFASISTDADYVKSLQQLMSLRK